MKQLITCLGIGAVVSSLLLSFLSFPALAQPQGEDYPNIPPRVKEEIMSLPLEPISISPPASGPISSIREGFLKYYDETFKRGQTYEEVVRGQLVNIAKAKPAVRKAICLFLNTFPYDNLIVFMGELPPNLSQEELARLMTPVKDRFDLLAVASCFTGHYGGFMDPIMPLLNSLFPPILNLGLGGCVFDPAKVKVFIRDNRSDPALMFAAMESFRAEKVKLPLIICFDPETTLSAGPLWGEYGWLNPTIGSGAVSTTYSFNNQWCTGQCIHDEEMAEYVRYFTMEYPKQTGNPPPKKYAMLVPTIPFYENCVEIALTSRFFKQLSQEYGVEYVGKEIFSMTATDVTPQLLRLNNKGAEVLLGGAVGGEAGVMIKNLKSLGMDKTTKFGFFSYAGIGDVAKIVGLPTMEGFYSQTTGGNQMGEVDQRGIKEWRFIYNEIVGYKVFPGFVSPWRLVAIFDSVALVPIKHGGFANVIQMCKTDPESVVKWFEECIWNDLNHGYASMEGGPLLYLPGKTSQEHTQIAQWQDGKYGMDLYAVKYQNGTHWEWVPPNVIPYDNPLAPRANPIPLEGSIDYGFPFGVWDLNQFFKEYQDESYIWEHDDSLVPEFYPQGKREGIPLWWFIFSYAFNDEGRLDKGMLYEALDKYFTLKGRTPDEAKAELEKFVELYYLPDHWVEWLSEYGVKG